MVEIVAGLGEELSQAVSAPELRRVGRQGAAGDEEKVFLAGRFYDTGQISRAGEQIAHAALILDTDDPVHGRIAKVAIDQKHPFAHAREVERNGIGSGRLALGGPGAGEIETSPDSSPIAGRNVATEIEDANWFTNPKFAVAGLVPSGRADGPVNPWAGVPMARAWSRAVTSA
jgi:hypothetical protein